MAISSAPAVARPPRAPATEQLARVIELPRRPEAIEREVAQHVSFLDARHGERWRSLPSATGRPALRAEALLALAPLAVDPASPPGEALDLAGRVAAAAVALAGLVEDPAEVLGDALSASILDLPLARLSAVVDAVLELGSQAPAASDWAAPASALLADTVLVLHRDLLRDSARLHQAVYAQLTDQVWDIPDRVLERGRRRLRPLARLRLRRAMDRVSRDGHAPVGAADLVRQARGIRAELAAIAPLLAHHLGEHDHGVLTDVDVALASLHAVRRVHGALDDCLDVARLERLLVADAFRDDAIRIPARHLRIALTAWAADLDRLARTDDGARSGPELRQWAGLVGSALPALVDALTSPAFVAVPPPSVRALVNDLLARERINDLTRSAL